MRGLLTALLLLFLVGCARVDPMPTPTPSTAPPLQTPTPMAKLIPTAVPPTLHPTAAPTPVASVPIPDAPSRDLFDLARRYRGVSATPLLPEHLHPRESVDQQRTFTVVDTVRLEAFLVDATLRHVSRRALWYVASDAAVDQEDLERSARRFDQEVYPLVAGTFTPASRETGPITVLTAHLPGVLGYFAPMDQYPASVHRLSNGREMLYVDISTRVGSPAYLGTLAHELQHALHWRADRNEATWLNEGLSEAAARLGGYPATSLAPFFTSPETSLILWPESIRDTIPSYGAASTFVQYLMERTGGPDGIGRLVSEPADGVAGVRAYLAAVAPRLSFQTLFADWTVANSGAAGDSRGYRRPPGSAVVRQVLEGPGLLTDQTPQYGAWYLLLAPSAPLEVTFAGDPFTPLLPVAPHSGRACWWSNRGDSMDATLTRSVDLTGVESATLRFWHWYRMEETWDYGYVAVSTDNGLRWRALEGQHSSSHDPLGNAQGPGFTGRSRGWVEERVDLSPFADGHVLLRFEYVTDEGVNLDGWCIDDIAIPEVGFSDDAEADGDWLVEGFVRVPGTRVPQRFVVSLVRGVGDVPAVERLALDAHNRGSFVVVEPALLVVAAMADKTGQPASFAIEARPAP